MSSSGGSIIRELVAGSKATTIAWVSFRSTAVAESVGLSALITYETIGQSSLSDDVTSVPIKCSAFEVIFASTEMTSYALTIVSAPQGRAFIVNISLMPISISASATNMNARYLKVYSVARGVRGTFTSKKPAVV